MSGLSESNKDVPQVPIAIIGMGCIFPTARNLAEFWRTLRTGRDCITEVPPSHWKPEDYFDPDPKKPDMTYCTRGGFLSQLDFDPTEFGIPPTILEATDTTQLLGLVAAKAALEDGGYGESRDFNRDSVSVVVGVTGTQELVLPLSARLGHPIWRKALAEAGVAKDVAEDVVRRIADGYVPWQENSFPGLLGNVVAGRIANRLNLRGTNCAVDAACASSLSAIHLAMMELATGRSDLAVAGGADTLNDIFMYMCFSKTPALSPTGDARPFASDADGTVLGEGVGMVLLKRLEDAERDGDRIYAVLKSIGTSSDGRSQSIYAPHAAGQARALRDAYRRAGFGPETVELIEAHGTGTKVGDATEFEALKNVFGETQREGSWCAIGSIKSQIGHTKAAAGVAGLMKAALAIHHRALPPTIKVREPNAKMEIDESPFYVSTELRPWLSRPGRTRRAGVSAFGFGGSNFHAVLEEHDASIPMPAWDGSVQIIALSAATLAELGDELAEWASYANSDRAGDEMTAFRAAQSRSTFSADEGFRLTLVIDEKASVRSRIAEAAARLATTRDETSWTLDGAYFASGPVDGKLAFVFPGQGSQYVKMGRDLACAFPEMISTLAEAEQVSGQSLGEFIYPKPTFAESQRARQADALTRTDLAQPALAATCLGMTRVLERFGVRPSLTAGHSFGELVALHTAGRYDAATLHRLARLRGRLMAEGDGDRGAMAAVKAPGDALAAMLAENEIDAVIANRNSPTQCVLSGDRPEIARAMEACKSRGWAATALRVSGAFHSRLMESAVQPFRNALEAVDFREASVPVYSNTMGAAYPVSSADARRILGEQLVRPVNFVGEIEAMHAAGARVFVEVGPKSVATGLVREILGDRAHTAIALDASAGRSNGVADLALALARLAALGFAVDLANWEQPATEPRTAKMVVPLSGANYRAPRVAEAKKPAAEPVKTTPVVTPVSKPAPAESIPEKPRPVVAAGTRTPPIPVASQASRAAPSTIPFETTSGTSMNAPPREPTSENPPPPSAAMQESMRLIQQGLAAMQRLQQQTAEAHQRFLEGQTEAHKSLQMILESHQRTLGGTANHDERIAKAPSARREAPTPIPTSIESPARRQPVVEIPSLPTAAVKAPVETARAPEPVRVPVAPAPKVVQVTESVVAPSKPAGPDRVSVQSALVAVVCEKTGYPAEMIEMGMDIEADLGVDSIKRVEIIAGLEERIPSFGGVKPEYMGSIRTLAQIVDYVAGQEGTAAAGPSGSTTDSTAQPSPRTALSPVSATSETPSPDRSTFEKALLGVVAELTGYPLDMLELGMDMEADLGIDSIKRVEILAGVESRVPGLPPVKPEYMGSLRTLAQIADYCVGQTAADQQMTSAAAPTAPQSAETALSPSPEKKTDSATAAEKRRESLNRRLLSLVHLPAAVGDTIHVARDREILVTDDGAELSRQIVARLDSAGYRARLIPIDAADSPGKTPVGAVIIVAPPRSAGETLWRRETEDFTKYAFSLMKSSVLPLQAAASRGGALFATIARMDGGFGLVGGSFDAAQGALAGLAKTAAREWPNVTCRALDVACSWNDAKSAAAAVVRELGAPGPIEVGLDSTGRRGLQLETEKCDSPSRVLLNPGDLVLVTGGARGVTADAALALARRYRPTLVLFGRTALPDAEPAWLASIESDDDVRQAVREHEFAGRKPTPKELKQATAKHLGRREIRRNLARVEAAGAIVRYVAVDVCDAEQVREAIRDAVAKFGPVRGLIHGAGIIEDRKVENKTPEQFAAVFDTKVAGLRHILDAIDTAQLRGVVMFSSVSGRCGNVGQADYAAANEVLNKASQRLSAGLPEARVVSINWGPWDGGMVHPALRQEFVNHGLRLVPVDDGAEFVADELAAGGGVEIVAGADFESVPGNTTKPQTASGVAGEMPAEAREPMVPAFERLLDVESHSFLRSHVIDGRPVLPAAMMMEWLAHAAMHANPGLQFQGLSDFRVLRGVVIRERPPLLKFVAGRPRRSGEVFDVDVEMRSTGDSPASPELVHARATVVLTTRLSAPPPYEARPELIERAYERGAAGAYAEVLFHGEAFAGIERVDGISAHGVVVRVRPTPAAGTWMVDPLRSHWLTDPLAIDGAFQAAILWSVEEAGAPCLPAAVGSYRQYRASFPPEPVSVVVETIRREARRCLMDVTILARDGGVVARMEGVDCTIDAGLERAFRRREPADVVRQGA